MSLILSGVPCSEAAGSRSARFRSSFEGISCALIFFSHKLKKRKKNTVKPVRQMRHEGTKGYETEDYKWESEGWRRRINTMNYL